MARLRYNGLTTTLGASLTSGATSVTFAAALTHSGGTAVPTITGSDYIPLTILDASGGVSEIVYLTAYTSGATTGTIIRGQEGTTGVVHASGDKVVQAPTVLDVTGGLLAIKSHFDATGTAYSTTSTDDNMVDVDATNLAVTFTAPASGQVLVKMRGLASMNETGSIMYWGLREGTTLVTGSRIEMWYIGGGTAIIAQQLAYSALITGLTPGTSHTYKWAWKRELGTATLNISTADLNADSQGAALMEVWAA